MISLKQQIYSLGFSFFFGIIFFVLVRINHKVLFARNRYIKLLGTFLFMLDISIGYFLCMRYINDGYLHIYFLILLLLGIMMGYLIFSRGVKK